VCRARRSSSRDLLRVGIPTLTGPSSWQGNGWSVEIADDRVVLRSNQGTYTYPGVTASFLSVVRRWFRWQLVSRREGVRRYSGLTKADAQSLQGALTRHIAGQRTIDRRMELDRRAEAVRPVLKRIVRWWAAVQDTTIKAEERSHWISREQVEALIAARPSGAAVDVLGQDAELWEVLGTAEIEALHGLQVNLFELAAAANARTLERELRDRRGFFDSVEKSPLTREQAEAVITFDNRVRVIAAAGSGKTSVMVARAAYAVEREYTSPERILVLAFNKDAAAELQERIEQRLNPLGIDTARIRASTFHSFGLSMIGEATGAKPRLAMWLDGGQDIGMVSRIVDELRDQSPKFRYQWDLFRLVFARALRTPATGEAEWYDGKTRVSGFRTRNGETVRSEGERMIADWLFTNGVAYQYERPYDRPTATPDRSQYQPDFFYPQIDAWHEHWALDEQGEPPAEFKSYAEGVQWKRRIHAANGTDLIESTWAEVMSGGGLEKLAHELQRRGITLDWNPDRQSPVPTMKHEELAALVRQFMSHVKSNSRTRQQIAKRIAEMPGPLQFRSRLFLDLYWPIHEAWEHQLANEGVVDFEDMLLRAADLLEKGEASPPYDLILVDEFQDSSVARARLVRALLKDPDKYLMTVGDDWQSINRFAGADLSIMTDFERWFGKGPTLRLETTFRCPQPIADVAAAFVAKNPRQLRKTVRSANSTESRGVRCVRASSVDDIPDAVDAVIKEIAARVRHEKAERPVRVDVLGRYGFDADVVPRAVPDGIALRFRTAHGSKGLEADFIVIPRMVSGRHGFPSGIEDDPLVDLVMADPDLFEQAEERRLFYVALTRARRETILVTVKGKESPFIVELINDGLIHVEDEAGPNSIELCPKCGRGVLVTRDGRYGKFQACGRFPACDFKRASTTAATAPF
jgi:DNA helicase IV